MIPGKSMTLPFRPAVTTFEFRLRKVEGQDVSNVKKFELIIADEVDGHTDALGIGEQWYYLFKKYLLFALL